jgi:hypothetical protein
VIIFSTDLTCKKSKFFGNLILKIGSRSVRDAQNAVKVMEHVTKMPKKCHKNAKKVSQKWQKSVTKMPKKCHALFE